MTDDACSSWTPAVPAAIAPSVSIGHTVSVSREYYLRAIGSPTRIQPAGYPATALR
ncbi:hypothetical protein SAMN06264364_14129 [Quadrisphaera granulorum]|uniref:Uncharacterized protein n=1 Tax=Quadrisphaera granulorum TaxID=317664 RepID=A0A315ZPA9_9ACTN|nr:hypothetical protein BXY45_14129 [Quadrisphaera granulorum]SZE98936.1 hypothetical protein SAMN06264364_14129 [Quadrisphaera granulorum]